jgi:pilus assembly protein TadC
MAETALEIIGRSLIPKRWRPDLRIYLLKAGYSDVPYGLFGIMFVICAVISLILYFSFFYKELLLNYSQATFFALTFILYAVTTFGVIFTAGGMLYFSWNIKIYNRTKELELLLPDYLTLVSTNLKGGMSFENALWSAIKPEFGILANEIGLVSKRVMTGNDVTESLLEFSMKYDSPILRRNVQLLTSEFESGGKITATIDRIISDLKKTQQLKKEMASSTVTYMIFIGMLVVLIMPVLFALSLQLFVIISGVVGQIAGNMAGVQTTMRIGAPEVSRSDFRIFSIMAITIIAVCSSMIISIIEKGDLRGGLKYIPMFLISSWTIYFIASGVLGFLFGGIKA